MRHLLFACLLCLCLAVPAQAGQSGQPICDGCTYKDDLTIVGPHNFLTGWDAVNADGTFNLVVEIPSGTNEKWEVKDDGLMHWDIKKGKPRVVAYLPYPGNYGCVPNTKSGDGDPLDVLVLGPARPRGAVIKARLVGILKFTDDGEMDDKLLAVVDGDPLGEAKSLQDLEMGPYYNAVTMVRTFFQSYKGPGEMFFQGYGDKAEAEAILKETSTPR